MPGARQSKASHRRDVLARESARQERITLIAAGVLVAVVIIAAAGVVWGVILPPRAHILTVGDRTSTAADVRDRAVFLFSGAQAPGDPVDAGVEQIRRDEILLQAGASRVDPVTDEELTAAIRDRVGVAEDASAEDYATAYETFLRGAAVDRPTFERMVRAQLVDERLVESYKSEVGKSGLQLHLLGVTGRDQAKLTKFREAVAGGAEFAATAAEMELVARADSTDLGWTFPPEDGFLHDVVKLQDRPAEDLTEVIPRESGFVYDVYRVAERDEARVYTDAQVKALAGRLLDGWIEEQRGQLSITEDVSDRERRWIVQAVLKEAQRIAKERAKATSVPGPVTTVTIPAPSNP